MTVYDIALLGHYTKDTIVSASGTRVVDGGAFNYGEHVTVRMGLKVAAVTSLKMEAEGPFRREIGQVEDLKRRMYGGSRFL